MPISDARTLCVASAESRPPTGTCPGKTSASSHFPPPSCKKRGSAARKSSSAKRFRFQYMPFAKRPPPFLPSSYAARTRRRPFSPQKAHRKKKNARPRLSASGRKGGFAGIGAAFAHRGSPALTRKNGAKKPYVRATNPPASPHLKNGFLLLSPHISLGRRRACPSRNPSNPPSRKIPLQALAEKRLSPSFPSGRRAYPSRNSSNPPPRKKSALRETARLAPWRKSGACAKGRKKSRDPPQAESHSLSQRKCAFFLLLFTFSR